MKKLVLYSAVLMIAAGLSGQNPKPHLVTSNHDIIGLSKNAPWNARQMLVEAGPNSFYFIHGSDYASVDHPKLNEVGGNYSNIYFIKYDENGDTIASNHLRGTYTTTNAFSFKGGLTLVGNAFRNVQDANDNVLVPVPGETMQEFIASFDAASVRTGIQEIWEPGQSINPNSFSAIDKRDGSVYIAGSASRPMMVKGGELIGEGWENYLYVIKFDRNLERQWIFHKAGVDSQSGQSGWIMNVMIYPDVNNNVVITGAVEGDRSMIIDKDTLRAYPENNYSIFAFKLDRFGNKGWHRDGTCEGYTYGDNFIFKGFPMKNGDMVLAGMTSSGHFRYDDTEFRFKNGEYFTNLFAFRIDLEGNIRWSTSLQNMGQIVGKKKKGAGDVDRSKGIESDQYSREIYQDAIMWDEQMLYMTSSYMIDTFEVAGKRLDKILGIGIFVAGIEVGVDTFEQEWGYGLSSDWAIIYGFDCDAVGNVSLMAGTGEDQNLEVFGDESVPRSNLILHLGLDYEGKPLWYNNAYLQGLGYSINGSDLEVLRNGEVFSTIYLSTTDALLIGEKQLDPPDYPYSTWLVALGAGNEFGGNVTTIFDEGPVEPVHTGYIKAYKSAKSGAFPVVDSTILDATGKYHFPGLYPGNYTFQVVPDPDLYPRAMPTYLGNAVSWSDAEFKTIETSTNVTFMDITMFQFTGVSHGFGEGTMSGNISYEDDNVLKSTSGDPVTKTSVILIKKAKVSTKSTLADGDVVAHVQTDEELGDYVFEDVPDGEYLLIVDIVGLPMIQTYEVVIEGNMIVEGLDFTVSGEGINTSGTVDVKSFDMEQFMMFPNPGKGYVFLAFPEPGDYQIRVFSTDGRLVRSQDLDHMEGVWKLDIREENRGIYLISIEGNGASFTRKYVKE